MNGHQFVEAPIHHRILNAKYYKYYLYVTYNLLHILVYAQQCDPRYYSLYDCGKVILSLFTVLNMGTAWKGIFWLFNSFEGKRNVDRQFLAFSQFLSLYGKVWKGRYWPFNSFEIKKTVERPFSAFLVFLSI